MERRARRLRQWDETAAALREGLSYRVSAGIAVCGLAGAGLAASLALASGGILESESPVLRMLAGLALAVIAAVVLGAVVAGLRRCSERQAVLFTRASWPVPADLDRGDLDETADLPFDVRLPEDARSPADLARILAPTAVEWKQARRRLAREAGLGSRPVVFGAVALAGPVVAGAGMLLGIIAVGVLESEGLAVAAGALAAGGAAAGVASSQANAVWLAVLRGTDAQLARSRRLLVELWPGDLEVPPLAVRDGVASIDRRALAGSARRPAPSSPSAGRAAPIVMLALLLLLVSVLPLLS